MMLQKVENLKDKENDTIGFPICNFFYIDEFVVYDHKKSEIILASFNKDVLDKLEDKILNTKINRNIIKNNKELNIKYHITKDEFIKRVEKAKEYINNGDIFQVVLSQRVSLDIDVEPILIYKSLRKINPSRIYSILILVIFRF